MSSFHVACLGVFSTELTRDLAGRMDIDPRVRCGAHTRRRLPRDGPVTTVGDRRTAARRGRGRRRRRRRRRRPATVLRCCVGAARAADGEGARTPPRPPRRAPGREARQHSHRRRCRQHRGNDDITVVVSDLGECLDMALHHEHGFATPAIFPRGGASAFWAPEVAGAAVKVRGATIDYDKQVRALRVSVRLGCRVWPCLHST